MLWVSPNSVKRFSRCGSEICHIPLHWPLTYTTACTGVQALMLQGQLPTYITRSNVDVSSESQCVSAVEHRLGFSEYKLSLIVHLLSLISVFHRKILTICHIHRQTHAQLTNVSQRNCGGSTENAGIENAGQSKMQVWSSVGLADAGPKLEGAKKRNRPRFPKNVCVCLK